jgi:hypothetical protein
VARSVVRSVSTADVPGWVVGALPAADVAGRVIRAAAKRAHALVVGTVMMPYMAGPVIGTVAARDMADRVISAVTSDGDSTARYGRGRDSRSE